MTKHQIGRWKKKHKKKDDVRGVYDLEKKKQLTQDEHISARETEVKPNKTYEVMWIADNIFFIFVQVEL